jgi:D-arginine dehydrogenase
VADVIVLGAGMAGASVAAELAAEARVLLLETEDRPDRHSTGRSAAVFFESYGNATVRALTRASRGFLMRPPEGFASFELVRPRSALFVADAARVDRLEAVAAMPGSAVALERLEAVAAVRLCPLLDSGWVAGGVLDRSGQDIDVAALHQGYLRMARQRGAGIVFGAGDVAIERVGPAWLVRSAAGEYRAPILVNATGAWADEVARRAGVPPVGLTPLRRTVAMLPAPSGVDMADWPMVIDADETFYFKPDGAQILLSPANEDPSPPCDVMPDELDVAIAVDRFETATGTNVSRVNHRWAGLRSFVADRSPVCGYDDSVEGFFWLAGQGGYGIQMAPALARAASALVMRRELPADLRAEGVQVAALSPARAELRDRRLALPVG